MLKLNLRTVLGFAYLSLALISGGCSGGGGSPIDQAQTTLSDSGNGGGSTGGGSTGGGSTGGGSTGGGSTGGGSTGGNPLETTLLTISNTLPANYRWADLSTGTTVYIDRTFTFTIIPSQMQGLKFLQTANNDKWISDPAAIVFDANVAITVFVAYDSRISALPNWLQSWTDSGLIVQTTDTRLKVFKKDFAAGNITLGGNAFGQSMYIAAITPVTNSNSPLTISGTPATSITEGMAYGFIPTTAGGPGSPTFSITNKPAWASFNTSNGALTGTPGIGDIGTTSSGIVISASNNQQTVSLQAFAITVLASGAGTATLSWSAPTQNADNTPLTDLAGYNIYYGTSAGNYPNTVKISNPGITTSLIENLAPGTWFFVVTAFDTSGNESAMSAAVSKTLP